jgi:predicted nucleotidyltransferase
MELTEYLESLFGKKVNILTTAGLRGIRVPHVARSIEENIIYV